MFKDILSSVFVSYTEIKINNETQRGTEVGLDMLTTNIEKLQNSLMKSPVS